jgi:tripartite motif-containing protein 71
MRRFRTTLLTLLAVTGALLLTSCGGSGIGTSFGKQPGIYFVDDGNSRVVWVSDMNATFFSSFGPGISGVSSLYNATIGNDGRLYLIDQSVDAIVRFDDIAADGRLEFGSHGSGTGQFLNPVRVAVDGQNRVYVVDRDRNELIRFVMNSAQPAWTTLDLSPWFSSSDEPDLTIDSFGHILMAGGSKIVQLNGMSATGALTFGTPGTGTGQFNSLTGICIDAQNRIYVADGTNNRIARINNITGTGWIAFGSTGTGLNQFNIAFGVGVDHIGKIYIGDRNNHRLVRIDDMLGTNWTELDNLPSGGFGTVLSVFPHLPTF